MSQKKQHSGIVTGVRLSSCCDYVELTVRIPLEKDEPNLVNADIYQWEVATKVEVKEK